MIIISSESELLKHLDEPSHMSIKDFMQKDSSEFYLNGNFKDEEWVARVICMEGSNHEGSKIEFGYLLRYQFKKTGEDLVVGIKQLKIANNIDDFLDLYNEVARNPKVLNVKNHRENKR